MAKIAFTAGRVSGFKCPPEKKQAFLWDATAPGLGLRATPAGKPAYVFQSVYQGKDLRITIGSPAAWSIPDAQAKARELQRLIDEGKDPRDLKREAIAAQAEKQAAAAAKVEADKAAALPVGEAWAAYLEARRPHWGERHYTDHATLAKAGGEPAKRGTRGRGVTIARPLHPLLGLALPVHRARYDYRDCQDDLTDRGLPAEGEATGRRGLAQCVDEFLARRMGGVD